MQFTPEKRLAEIGKWIYHSCQSIVPFDGLLKNTLKTAMKSPNRRKNRGKVAHSWNRGKVAQEAVLNVEIGTRSCVKC